MGYRRLIQIQIPRVVFVFDLEGNVEGMLTFNIIIYYYINGGITGRAAYIARRGARRHSNTAEPLQCRQH
jgi:hypothetical protein